MKNLLLAIVIAILCYGIGHWGGGSWLTGIIPGMLGFLIAYFVLARRSLKKLEGLSAEAMKLVQEGQNSQDPQKMLAGMEHGITIFEKGLDLAKEQFLMAEIIHTQMGTLLYQGGALNLQLKMQEDMRHNRVGATKYESKAKKYFTEARYHLEKAHSKDWTLTLMRTWQGPGMLAAMEYRDGKKKEAIERMAKCKSVGKSDPLFWGAYSWMLHGNAQETDAMITANEGLSTHSSNKALQKFSDAIANKKSLEPIHFGMMWYSIFPEQLTVDVVMKLQSQAPNEEANGQMNRQMRRALKKKGYTN